MSNQEQPMSKGKFVFRKHSNIGAADAIQDSKFLETSFVDNGALEVLLNMQSHVCIILGRTGSGKTALLEKISSKEDRVIKINPEALALTYISASGILRFFTEAGVNLEPFYHLLWTHVFVVELIRNHYNINSEQDFNNFWMRVKHHFERDKSKRDAIEYLKKYAPSFWKNSEYRVQEITTTIEKDLRSSLDAQSSSPIPSWNVGFTFNIGGARKLTEEQKVEVLQRGREVVSSVQIRMLNSVVEFLENDLLDDKQKEYYITIDRLDENWVDEQFSYGLIKALLDTIKNLNSKIKRVKIIVAIREDLLDRVFRETRGQGHQEEKYRSLYMSLRWNQAELEQLLNLRVNQLIKEQYTNYSVKLVDIFPNRIGKQPPLNYFFERTLFRPRDAILFFNECIKVAENRPHFTQNTVMQAELLYSEGRLRALADEWADDYKHLFELTCILKKYPSQFRFTRLADNITDEVLKYLTIYKMGEGPHKDEDSTYHLLYGLLMNKADSPDVDSLTEAVLRILFRVGVVGIKTESFMSISWSFLGQKLPATNLNSETIIRIHPAFWRVLGIMPIE